MHGVCCAWSQIPFCLHERLRMTAKQGKWKSRRDTLESRCMVCAAHGARPPPAEAGDGEQLAFVPTELPSSIEEIMDALMKQPGIEGVSLGRQVSFLFSHTKEDRDKMIILQTLSRSDGIANFSLFSVFRGKP